MISLILARESFNIYLLSSKIPPQFSKSFLQKTHIGFFLSSEKCVLKSSGVCTQTHFMAYTCQMIIPRFVWWSSLFSSNVDSVSCISLADKVVSMFNSISQTHFMVCSKRCGFFAIRFRLGKVGCSSISAETCLTSQMFVSMVSDLSVLTAILSPSFCMSFQTAPRSNLSNKILYYLYGIELYLRIQILNNEKTSSFSEEFFFIL